MVPAVNTGNLIARTCSKSRPAPEVIKPDRAKRFISRAHHFAKRGRNRRIVQILKHHDRRPRQLGKPRDLLVHAAISIAPVGGASLRNAAVAANPTIGGNSGNAALMRPSIYPRFRGTTSNSSMTFEMVGVSNLANSVSTSGEVRIFVPAWN